MRHGQSTWNRAGRFTGWEDPPLTSRGRAEARTTARKLLAEKIQFDAVFSSYLRRAAETLWIIQQQMNLMWLPSHTDWRLNERHYGALQGEKKADMEKLHGAQQVHEWRRGYESRPPPGGKSRVPDHRYDETEIPSGENLADTAARVLECFEESVLPLLRAQKRVLIVAHGNSLRALIMHLSRISPDEIMHLEIPTGGATKYSCKKDGAPVPPHSFIF